MSANGPVLRTGGFAVVGGYLAKCQAPRLRELRLDAEEPDDHGYISSDSDEDDEEDGDSREAGRIFSALSGGAAPQLEVLSLSYCSLDWDFRARGLQGQAWRALKELKLESVQMGPGGFSAFIETRSVLEGLILGNGDA